ncbi:MAG: hypothetical protein WAN86_21300, partial [Hyphomicrobiaceae bacterium]
CGSIPQAAFTQLAQRGMINRMFHRPGTEAVLTRFCERTLLQLPNGSSCDKAETLGSATTSAAIRG